MGAYDDLLPVAEANPYSDLTPTSQPHEASTPWESFVAGYQGSATGLLKRGRLPDITLDPRHAPWYDNALSTIGSVGSDLPEMAAAAWATKAGGPRAAWAAANAVPTEIREALSRAYQTGEADSSSTFLQRAGIIIKGLSDPDILKATAKAGAVGALTAQAGITAGRLAGPLLGEAVMGGRITAGTARTAYDVGKLGAEAGTLAVAPAALEGRLPEPWEIANAAILVGGMRAAGHVAGKISDIYARTGVKPEEVVADSHTDPTIAEDLKTQPDGDIPRAYQPLAAEENAKMAIPEPSAAAQKFVESPFAEVPQQPGDPKVDLHVNYDYVNEPEDVKAVLARASQLYGDKIEQQTRGNVSWEQTEQEGAEKLAEMVGAKDTSLLSNRTPGTASGTTEMYLRGQLLLGAVEDFTRKAQDYDPLTSSPADALKMRAAAERVGMLSANFQGASSEAGRALNALKMVNMGLRQADAIAKMMEGEPDAGKIAEMMKTIDNPVGAAKVARKLYEPKAMSTLQKINAVWKAGLLSGTKIFQVKAIGDNIAIGANVADRYLASIVGRVTGSADRIVASDVAEYIGGIQRAGKDTLRVLGANWTKYGQQRTAAEPEGVRTIFGEGAKPGEPTQPPKPGSAADIANRVVNIPGRIIATETELYKTFNEQGEAQYLAARQARDEGFTHGTDDYNSRVYEIMRNPSPEMQLAIEQAGKEGTYTNRGGKIWKILHAIHEHPIGGFIIPFDTVPANLTKWAVARMPGAAFMLDTVREELAAGGARRDVMIARQMIGGAVMAAAYGAVKSGALTGGGLFMTPQEREGQDETRQDYSIKFGDKSYGITRFEPISRMVQLAADVAEIGDKLDKDDRASLPLMVLGLFGHATLSETYLSGMNNLVKMLDDPTRAAPQYFDQLIGSFVPSLLAQVASAHDPDKRRVDNAFDAVQSRLPFLREQLLPNINPLTGDAIPNMKNLTPVDVKDMSTDPVLTEAARLGVGVSKAPKSIQLPAPDKKMGRVDLTPEQQTLFATTSGKLAHEILSKLVGTDAWAGLQDTARAQVFQKVLTQARKAGAAAALPANERIAFAQKIADKMMEKMK